MIRLNPRNCWEENKLLCIKCVINCIHLKKQNKTVASISLRKLEMSETVPMVPRHTQK